MSSIAALTAAFNCLESVGPRLTDLPVAAATKVYVGSILAINAAGNVLPASDTAGLHVLGRCEGLSKTQGESLVGQDADNSGGSAGDLLVNAKRGIFRWLNSVDHAITKAMIGKPAFVESDQAVNSTGGAHKIVAGTIVDVDSHGVWVDTTRPGAQIGLYTQTQDALVDNTTGVADTTLIVARTDTAAHVAADADTNFASVAAQLAKIKTDIAALIALLG